MNGRAIRALAGKDLLVVGKSKAVLLPIIIVPVIMLVVLPLVAALAPSLVNLPGASDIGAMLDRLPAGLKEAFASYDTEQRLLVLLIVYLFAPLYLIVPLMVASVIAADSFAGEKERKTLEALLYTPVSSRDLFVAKLLSGWLPAVAVAWLGFLLYALVANLAGWPLMGRIYFPNAMWLLLALWVAPAVAGLGLAATVLASARVKTFQEANQLAGVIVLPLVALVVSQAVGAIFLSSGLVFLLGLIVWIADLLLLAYGIRTFRRGELIAQL